MYLCVRCIDISSFYEFVLVVGLWFMLFSATFNNISVMLWRSVLLVMETGVTRFELAILVVISTDCTGSCKCNYHTIAITMALILLLEFENVPIVWSFLNGPISKLLDNEGWKYHIMLCKTVIRGSPF